MSRGFVLDRNRCTGCRACVLACAIENRLDPELSWRRVDTFNDRRHPAAPVFHDSAACHHCADPACLAACPTGAYRRDAATGAVLLDSARCVGCRYCSWACPYDAPVYDDAQGVMTKCTLCRDRLVAGREPACVACCPTGALGFGELEAAAAAGATSRPGEPVRPGLAEGYPDTTLDPSLRIVPVRPEREIPRMTAPPPEHPFVPPRDPAEERLDLRREWPLWAFTSLASVLTGLAGAALAGGPRPQPLIVPGLAAAGTALAALHLGRRGRAWRSAANLSRSWLSREIVLFGGFALLAAIWLGAQPGNARLGAATVLVGLATLAAIDRVYRPAVHPAGRLPHSAGAVLAGILVFGAAARLAWPAAAAGLATAVLYVARKRRMAAAERDGTGRLSLTALRLGAGLVAPAAVWIAAPAAPAWIVPALVVAGTLVDRLEFYLEVEIPTPRRALARALTRRLAAIPPA